MADTDVKAAEDPNKVTDTNHDELVDANEQPFMDHVIELRSRILRGLATVLVLFIPIYFVATKDDVASRFYV